MKKRGVMVLAMLALAGCGGVGVIPPADLQRSGSSSFQDCSICTFPGGFDFVGNARNLGPGCANAVRGVVKFVDAAGVQLGPSESWRFVASRVIRSGESFTFRVVQVGARLRDFTATTEQEFSWTDVKC